MFKAAMLAHLFRGPQIPLGKSMYACMFLRYVVKFKYRLCRDELPILQNSRFSEWCPSIVGCNVSTNPKNSIIINYCTQFLLQY